MDSLSAARTEWEATTTPYPLPHKQSYGEVFVEPFRKFGHAIAWLEWVKYNAGVVCEIKKLETLKRKTGAATSLLCFLKMISAKHSLHIYGNPTVYPSTCPLAAESPMTQEALDAWYVKRGFLVGKNQNGVPYLWYPNALWT
jgi:hypothetical protein